MKGELSPLGADDGFFALLLKGDAKGLEYSLADDFVLIDVMGGSEVPKSSLLELIESGQLKFESIESADRKVRTYADAALVTGRTRMTMRMGADAVSVASRYIHVFVIDKDGWRLVSAQGTRISPPLD